jgi:glycosyltransferase involved in cell wall biosynthesis
MNESPLVSVIVPCYNHETFVTKSIESIMNQTYKNIQLIVIDDGSIDNSVYILKELNIKYKFVLECQNNIGLAKTLNKALYKYATGKYICTLASDDHWPIYKIEEQVKFMEKHNEVALVFGNCYVVNKDDEIIRCITCDLPNKNIPFESLLKRNRIPALTTMVRKNILYEVGGYDESTFIEDWSTWLKIAYQYTINHVNNYWGYYRTHGKNISSDSTKMYEAMLSIVKKWDGQMDYKTHKRIQYKYELKLFRELAKKEKRKSLQYWPKKLYNYFNKNFIIGILNLISK